MLGLTVLLLGSPLLLAPVNFPQFEAAWRLEVLEGDFAGAAAQYERIYQDQLRGISVKVRRSAAYRAGQCFERTGRVANARHAYSWLAANSPWVRTGQVAAEARSDRAVEDVLAATARERARALPLESATSPDPVEQQPLEMRRSVSSKVAAWVQQLKADIGGLEETRNELARWGRVKAAAASDLSRLRRLFEERGVTLGLSKLRRGASEGGASGEGGPEDGREVLSVNFDELGLEALEEEHLRLDGVRYLFQSALHAASVGDRDRARDCWTLCAFLLEKIPADEVPESLRIEMTRRLLAGLSGAPRAEAARRLLFEVRLREWGRVQKVLRERLREARRWASARARPDYALEEELFGIPELLDQVSPGVRNETEIRELVNEARRLVSLVAQGLVGDVELEALWGRRFELQDESARLAAELLERSLVLHRTRQLTAIRSDVEQRRLGQAELKRGLQVAREELEEGQREAVARRLEVLRTVRDWFRVVDSGGAYRQQIDELKWRLSENHPTG